MNRERIESILSFSFVSIVESGFVMIYLLILKSDTNQFYKEILYITFIFGGVIMAISNSVAVYSDFKRNGIPNSVVYNEINRLFLYNFTLFSSIQAITILCLSYILLITPFVKSLYIMVFIFVTLLYGSGAVMVYIWFRSIEALSKELKKEGNKDE